MAIPRTRALRALPLAVAAPLAAVPAIAHATPARPHTVLKSVYGLDAPVAAVPGGRAVWTWSGGRAGGDVTSAEHTAGTGSWPAAVAIATGLPGGASSVRMAANTTGATVAAWLVSSSGPGGTTVTVKGARRTGSGTWAPLPDLATVPNAGDMARADLPTTPLDLAITPDGTAIAVYGTTDGAITAVRLASGAAAWDAPVTVRSAIPGRLAGISADLAVAAAPDGHVIAVWAENSAANTRSVQFAEWSAGTWSAAGPLPGGADGYYPDVAVTPAGEAIAAWTTAGGNWVATRPAGGAWGAVARAGGGYAPEIATGAQRVAITWPLAGRGAAVRNSPGGTWSATTAPVAPLAAAFARDDQLLIAGRLSSGVLVWSRLPARGAWAPARIASRQEDLIGAAGPVIAPAASGPLATLVWDGQVRQGRLGMRGGGGVVQGLDLSAATGDLVGASSRLRLPPGPVTVNAYGVLSVSPRFTEYAGPTAVRIQTRRAGRWHTVAGATADIEKAVQARVGGPGRLQVRLAHGPGFRRVTNAVRVTVARTAQPRVIAGWQPSGLAASGRDLWVVSGTRTGAHAELRLLDATTGRLRRGPVRIGLSPYSLQLLETGGPVLLDTGTGGVRVLDAALPGLIGDAATITPGGCTAAGCTPISVTVGATATAASRSVGYRTAPLRGPDGRVWGLGPGVDDEGGGVGGTVLESVAGGPPVTREAQGFVSYHGGQQADMLAVDGGLWFRGALGDVLWVGTAGPGVAKGNFGTIAGSGRCVWGLAAGSRPAVRRLREDAAASGARIPVDGGYQEGHVPFAVAARTGWVIATGDQALVKIPLPAC